MAKLVQNEITEPSSSTFQLVKRLVKFYLGKCSRKVLTSSVGHVWSELLTIPEVASNLAVVRFCCSEVYTV